MNHTRCRNAIFVSLAVLCVLCYPLPELKAEGVDSLCIHFNGSASNLHLELAEDYDLSGSLPFTICELQPGMSYRMRVDGPGLERKIGTLRISVQGRPSVTGVRLGTTLRNAVVPGWGSSYAGKPATGWMDGTSIFTSLYVFMVEDREYRHLRNRYDVWLDKYFETSSLEEKRRLQQEVHEAALEANVQNKHRKRLAILSAALYGHQFLDSWFSNSPPRASTRTGGSVVSIESSRSSRFKAFIHSLIRPGRGQFYQGKIKRGVVFSTLTLTVGIIALDYHNGYDMEANRYNLIVDRFDAATTLADKERFMKEASAQWSTVEDEKRRRNTAYIILAGLWSWNLLDTLFPSEEGFSSSKYAFELGPLGGYLVLTF
jgi:hypothetical protein